MQFLKIVGLGVLAAIGYGIVHDQVTVRVCLEYFTIFHPRLISSTSPTLLALAWGVAATWWVGLPLGLGLARQCSSSSSMGGFGRGFVRRHSSCIHMR